MQADTQTADCRLQLYSVVTGGGLCRQFLLLRGSCLIRSMRGQNMFLQWLSWQGRPCAELRHGGSFILPPSPPLITANSNLTTTIIRNFHLPGETSTWIINISTVLDSTACYAYLGWLHDWLDLTLSFSSIITIYIFLISVPWIPTVSCHQSSQQSVWWRGKG